jgi:hypothetical protein
MGDYATQYLNVKTILDTLYTMEPTYRALVSKQLQYQSDETTINQEIQSLSSQIIDLEQASETYEKEFLDRKEILSNKSNVQTLQDIVLFAFFLSFILISCLFIIYTGNFVKAFLYGVLAFLLGILLMVAIRLYG